MTAIKKIVVTQSNMSLPNSVIFRCGKSGRMSGVVPGLLHLQMTNSYRRFKMNDSQKQQYEQISMMDDESIITLYAASAKVLYDRGKLALTKKTLQKILGQKNPTNINSPSEFTSRGKVKRISNHSVLLDFLEEDWGYLFSDDLDQTPRYYVYYHSANNRGDMKFSKGDRSVIFNGRPFYIGKGTGDRFKSKMRSRSHLSVINSIIKSGGKEEDIFHIFKDGLTEKKAFELEAKLITFFGSSSELDTKRAHFHGMKGGLLINADPAVRPDCVTRLMRIKGL